MAKFIDSDFFRVVLNRMVEHLEAVEATRDAETIKSVIRFLKVMEEFHSVEMVRCKECKYYVWDDLDCCNVCVHLSKYVKPDFGCLGCERRTDDST